MKSPSKTISRQHAQRLLRQVERARSMAEERLKRLGIDPTICQYIHVEFVGGGCQFSVPRSKVALLENVLGPIPSYVTIVDDQ